MDAGNYGVLRAYTAAASVPRDRVKVRRTSHYFLMSLFQAISFATGSYVLGITIGPAIQVFFP